MSMNSVSERKQREIMARIVQMLKENPEGLPMSAFSKTYDEIDAVRTTLELMIGRGVVAAIEPGSGSRPRLFRLT